MHHTGAIILAIAFLVIQLASVSIEARIAETPRNTATIVNLDHLTHTVLAKAGAKIALAELPRILWLTDADWLVLNHLTGSLVTILVLTQ